VVWHTQGSGKSLTMAFYAGRVVVHPAMANPTLVVPSQVEVEAGRV
jgi:type I restriction enzyme R subunit